MADSAAIPSVRGRAGPARPRFPNSEPQIPIANHLSAIDLLLSFLSDGREPTTAGSELSAASREPSAVWNEVVGAAVFNGLAPLLFRRLKQDDARERVPAHDWERLRLAYLASAGDSVRLYRELRPVLRRLRESGIKVIVLKGAFLAEAVYGDAALRPMCDVDLMVPSAELSRAQAVLLDMGGVHQQTEDIESRCRKTEHLPALVIRGLTVEIHWTIAEPIGSVKVDAAGLWDRARPTTTAGVEVLALSPEDLLLHLCLHFGHRHRLAWLRSFYDITATIHRYRGEMDWAQVVRTAREWGATRYAGLALHLARSLLAAEVPDGVLDQLVPGGPDRRILETARESVLSDTGYGRRLPPFLDLVGARSLGDKARLSWRRVFLSRDEMAARYPASREAKHLGFYYLLRLRDLIRVYWNYNLTRRREMIQSLKRGREVSLVNWLKSGKP